MNAAERTIEPGGWRRTLRNALIITRREVRDSFRDWRIVAPIVLLTFFFPFLAQWAAGLIGGFLNQYGASFIGKQFIPFLLMVVGFFPISISLVIALETFVGEKERRSLEPLLSTPLSNGELYVGKTLAAMIPPLLASFGGMSFYLFTVFASGSDWRPAPMLVVQIFLLTIVQALVMVTGAVVVSSQTTSTRAANLLASMIIIPMTLVINAESIIIFMAPDSRSATGIGALWAIMVGMAVASILLLRVGSSIFNREELLGRTIDTINPGGVLRKIWLYVRAVDARGTPASNLLEWYTRAIPYSLRELKTPILVTIGVFVTFILMGAVVGLLPQFRLPLTGGNSQLQTIATDGLSGFTGRDTVLWVFLNNLRVVLVGTGLSAISFGVAGYTLIPVVFVMMGYLASQLIPAGYGMLLLTALVPHGVIEVPIIVIATASMFRLGAIVTRPPTGQTVGHVWVTTMGATIKILIGVVVPGLLLAALLEVYLTVPLLNAVFQ
jgi:ABC-type transport system involved in multi-copper enzyme maturation permease subunit